MCNNRINRDGDPRPSHYWCGFCRVLLPLKTQGVGAWNERYNHIDVEHFKKGERVEDWLLPSGHLTKSQERDEIKKQRADGNGYESEPAMDEISDDESVSSECAAEHEPLQDDLMAIDEEPTPETDSLQHNQSNSYPQSSNLRKRKFPALQSPTNPHRDTAQMAGLDKRSRLDSSWGSFYRGDDTMQPSRLPHEGSSAYCVGLASHEGMQ